MSMFLKRKPLSSRLFLFLFVVLQIGWLTRSKLILVTGASSFIGEWIIKLLLEKGYRVRGTVRSEEKAKKVLQGVEEKHRDRLSFVYVEDIARDSFDQAVENVEGIVHVASPFHFQVNDPEKGLLIPAINGTLAVLQSAHRYNQIHSNAIRRIVLTSSFASVLDATKGLRPGYIYREDDWCPLTYEDGVAAKNDPAVVYRASKVCAERAAWKFVEEEKPAFTLAALCEPMVFGPRVNGFHSMADLNTSNAILWSLISNERDASIPPTRVPMEVDVRDVAFAHVAALESALPSNERYLISAGSWSNQQIVDIIHQSSTISDRIKAKSPIGSPGEELPEHYRIETSKAERDLRVTFIPLKKTIEDLVEQLDQLDQSLAH